MKRFLVPVLVAALCAGLWAADVKVEIRNMTQGMTGNQRFPVVAENSGGEQLYCYRGSDRYAHYFSFKNGQWKNGGRIPGSPQFDDYWYGDIVTDSAGTFHFVCDDADSAMYYGYYKGGTWAPMRKIDWRHEATLALGIRSNDTIVLCSPSVVRGDKGVTKDVFLATKPKDDSHFSGFKNITQDNESSTMVDIAIDAEDNSWVAYKGAIIKGGEETLQTILLGLDKDHKEIYWKNVSGQEGAWCWYQRVAVNSEGQIMVTWMTSQMQQYFYRLYDIKTDKWTEVKPLMGGPIRPWPTMYNKILARGPEFYWIGLSGDRFVKLYHYDSEKGEFVKMADISEQAAGWVSAANGSDSLLISWDTMGEPTSCYLAKVTADFEPIIRIQPAANLKVEKRVERGFFHGYTLNALTWEANPINTELGVVIAAQRVYRKLRTESADKWVKLAELGATVYQYEDRNIPADSDYVYAVTCVDDKGVESPILDESQGATSAGVSIDRPVETRSRKDQ